MSAKQNVSQYMKISLLVVALSFLVYHIYWAILQVSWFFTITDVFYTGAYLEYQEYNLFLLAFQEYASIVGYFLILIGAIFSLQGTILFIKSGVKYIKKIGQALIFSSFFYILLLPSSLRHFIGVATTPPSTNIANIYSIYVGFSTLLQALLIGVPLLLLGIKLLKSQNQLSISKWVSVATPLCVFGLWSYASMLWFYALSPMGHAQASLMSTIGAANSLLTLLIAGILTAYVSFDFNRKKILNKRLAGLAIILVGLYALVYALVSIWVPIYFSFLQLTEIWLIVLPILGVAILRKK